MVRNVVKVKDVGGVSLKQNPSTCMHSGSENVALEAD